MKGWIFTAIPIKTFVTKFLISEWSTLNLSEVKPIGANLSQVNPKKCNPSHMNEKKMQHRKFTRSEMTWYLNKLFNSFRFWKQHTIRSTYTALRTFRTCLALRTVSRRYSFFNKHRTYRCIWKAYIFQTYILLSNMWCTSKKNISQINYRSTLPLCAYVPIKVIINFSSLCTRKKTQVVFFVHRISSTTFWHSK